MNRVSLATDSLIIFTNLVEKIALSLSAFFGFFTIIVLAYTICIYLGANKPVEGWAPLMGVNDSNNKVSFNYIKNGVFSPKLFD